jgi:hypothetical protein
MRGQSPGALKPEKPAVPAPRRAGRGLPGRGAGRGPVPVSPLENGKLYRRSLLTRVVVLKRGKEKTKRQER